MEARIGEEGGSSSGLVGELETLQPSVHKELTVSMRGQLDREAKSAEGARCFPGSASLSAFPSA